MKTEWSLSELYTSFESDSFKRDFDEMKKAIAEFNRWSAANLTKNGGPAEDAAVIAAYINKMNNYIRFYNLYSYAYLVSSTNAENETANKFIDLFRNEMTNLTKTGVMFTKFIKNCDIDGVLAACATCREHEFILREEKGQAAYLLADDVEEVMAKMKTTASGAWNVMKEFLTSTLTMDVTVEGEVKNLPLSAVRNLAHDPNPETRKNAYDAEIKSYSLVEKPVAAALNSIKGEVLTECKLRGYGSPLDMTLFNARMSRKALDALISAIEESLPSLLRFFAKKAQLLGHEKHLPYYDLFAPLVRGNSGGMRFTWEEACDFVVKIFTDFSQSMGDFAKKCFDERWVDAFPRKGKRGGAFCSNIHAIKQSRVLMNFLGSFSDVATLAHELGHAYHGFCLKDETYMNSSYTMPIAETASTFCETLVFDYAMKDANPDEKLTVLEGQLTDATQVIVDIYARYVFETELFAKRTEGPLSVSEINALMSAAQAKAYGDTFGTAEPHPYMWINKPHYYFPSRNFYNFPYAYGLMFSLGLMAEYKATGAAFVPKYDALLAATGKMSLADVGKKAGIDVESKEFWLSSLKQIEAKVDEFCGYN